MIINTQYHINVTLQILHKKGCISKTTAETCFKWSIWSVLYAPSFSYKEKFVWVRIVLGLINWGKYCMLISIRCILVSISISSYFDRSVSVTFNIVW